MLCQSTWLILHSRKFNYSTIYIKCNENNVQARKLNEPVGFLVSSLNKNEKQNKVGRTFYLHELCCFINVLSNSFSWLDSSTNFAFTGASSCKCKRFFTCSKVTLAAIVSNFSIDGGTAGKGGRPP